MTNLIGISLGRYHILEQLGEGGMATVYKAFDTRLERDVAVKVIRIEKLTLDTIAKSLKRFEREARALAKLDHPNIVRINDYGEYEHRPFLVMDYIPGGTLKQRLGKPIPWQEAFHFIIPITHALEYAHQQGIIHRDVKPSNILIGKSGVPILTDFGIAKFFESQETIDLTGTMGVGTPEYMAPEQATGRDVRIGPAHGGIGDRPPGLLALGPLAPAEPPKSHKTRDDKQQPQDDPALALHGRSLGTRRPALTVYARLGG